MTSDEEAGTTLILPAPLTIRDEIDVVYFQVDLRPSSVWVIAFDTSNRQVATLKCVEAGDGRFQLVCTRETVSFTIVVAVAPEASGIDGEIGERLFHVGDETHVGTMALDDVQRHVFEPFSRMGDSFVGLGEAVALRAASDPRFAPASLGCVATAMGTGVAAAACLDGSLPACALGLHGASYLADHCV